MLALIHRAFAAQEGRVAPPQSALKLRAEDVAHHAAQGEVWTLDEPDGPIACLFLTPRPTGLYLGKLAVDAGFQRQGLARQLVRHAEGRARAQGLGQLELETRIELLENHAAFQAMGFERAGKNAHPGFDRATSVSFVKPLGPA